MTLSVVQRSSDSPYIEQVMQGYTEADGNSIRPAETCWHMVFTKHSGSTFPIVVGPWTTSGAVGWGGDAEILWIKFKPGTFMPHLPTKNFLNSETVLPTGTHHS